jgi:hypothetical protein
MTKTANCREWFMRARARERGLDEILPGVKPSGP